ncbi:MAG: hypothetical protein AB7O66_06820 [Limisphaerales bacterium]
MNTRATPRPSQTRPWGLLTPSAVLLLVGSLLAIAPSTLACRYSVRDTGFVDLGSEPYRLILHRGPETPSPIPTDFEQAAAAVLLDANVRFTSQPSAEGTPSRLTLRSPDGRELPLALLDGPDRPSSRAEIVELLERAVASPTRTQLHDELLRAYAVLVLVEGSDAEANRRARQTLAEAISAITRLLPAMPKPVDVPPRILTIPERSATAESVLLWGLGMDPKPTRDPRVAVAFGRGRLVGAPLEGALITRTVVQDRLALIGQDCECDLDRASLQGPVIPARWDTARQRAAAAALGFDPENPLIRAEISRIVLKGPANPGARRTSSSAFDALALGYSEEPIELAANTSPKPDSAPESAPESETETQSESESESAPAATAATTAASSSDAATSSLRESPPRPKAPSAEPDSASPKARTLSGGILATWIALSGFGLVIALAGAWLLNRSRKDRS